MQEIRTVARLQEVKGAEGLQMEECFLLLSLVACCLCLLSCFSLYGTLSSDLELDVPALLSGKPYLSLVSSIFGFSKETLPPPYSS